LNNLSKHVWLVAGFACLVIVCGCFELEGMSLPSMQSPRAIVQTPSSPAQGEITITIQLIDREMELTDIAVQYSTDNGQSYNTATLVDPAAALGLATDWYPGITHTLIWDSLSDNIAISGDESVILKIQPLDAGSPVGTKGGSAAFTVNNTAYNQSPTAAASTPAGTLSGNIQINYFLSDAENDECDIVVEYSTDGSNWYGATMGPAGDGTSGLSSSSSGMSHMYLWNSLFDGVAPSDVVNTVRVRITPTDFHAGTAGETGTFSVDNTLVNLAPTVEITNGPAQGATVTSNQVTFGWTGSDMDGAVTGYYYSFDHDPPETWTANTSATSGTLSEGGHIFRIVAVDDQYALSTAASRTFTVNLSAGTIEAGFTASPRTGQAPLNASFTDQSQSTSGITSWYWSFGDGGTSTDSNPSHAYMNEGTYDVSLTVTGPDGADTETKNGYITVTSSGPGTPFELPFEADGMVFDAERYCIYATDQDGNKTVRLNATTGLVDKTVTHTIGPRHLVMTPDGTTLYISLPEVHSYTEDGSGAVAIVELENFTKTGGFDTDIEPYDLVATDSGIVVVGSGSGQWTSIKSYNAVTGEVLGSAGIRMGSMFDLHSDQVQVYSANNGLSPSDIEKFLIHPDGTLTAEGDSPYHGDHRMSGNVWVSPTKDYVVTRGADVFTSTPARATDMRYIHSIDNTSSFSDACFYEPQNVLLSIEGSKVQFYNMASFIRITSVDISSTGWKAGVMGGKVFVALTPVDGKTVIEHFNLPITGGHTNTLPVAVAGYTPTNNLTVSTNITFSAAGSSDEQESSSSLLYRWDFDNDGVFETIWSHNQTAQHTYDTNGLKFIRLEVRDSLGLVSSDTVTAEIGTSYYEAASLSSASVRGFTGAVVVDPVRNYCFMTIPAQEQVVEINLGTGSVERTVSVEGEMESMCITPNGEKLYVSLLVSGHSSYHGDGTGKFAVVNVGTFTKTNVFAINIDPFDIVATDSGVVVISCGSGQHTDIKTYNGTTGEEIGSAGIRQRSYIDLHPDQQQVYAADTDVSPSDIEKYIINPDGSLISEGDSPYHGDHRMSGNVWVAPTGDFVITRGGDAFVSSMNELEDMVFIAEMAEYAIKGIGFIPGKSSIMTLEQDKMKMYDYNNYSYKTMSIVGDDYERMFVKGNTVYIQKASGLYTEFTAVGLK